MWSEGTVGEVFYILMIKSQGFFRGPEPLGCNLQKRFLVFFHPLI